VKSNAFGGVSFHFERPSCWPKNEKRSLGVLFDGSVDGAVMEQRFFLTTPAIASTVNSQNNNTKSLTIDTPLPHPHLSSIIPSAKNRPTSNTFSDQPFSQSKRTLYQTHLQSTKSQDTKKPKNQFFRFLTLTLNPLLQSQPTDQQIFEIKNRQTNTK